MNVKIGTAPCSWGVWYADGTPSKTPYNVFLDQAAASGYTALELGPIGYLPTDPAKLSEELGSRRLSICAGTVCEALDKYESFDGFKPKIDELCQRLRHFNAPYIVAMDESDVGLYSEKKETMPHETWVKYIKMVGDMAHFTKEQYGIEVVYHPHVKTLVEYEKEIEELMELTGMNLCFDTGHHAYSNGSWEMGDRTAIEFLKKHAAKIPYLHFKNVNSAVRKKVFDEHIDADTAFDIDVMGDLKDGIIDFVELTQVLRDINFNGYAIIEQDMPRATTEEAFAAAKRNLEYLKTIGMIG